LKDFTRVRIESGVAENLFLPGGLPQIWVMDRRPEQRIQAQINAWKEEKPGRVKQGAERRTEGE
jgi:hypothetical protein